MITPDGPHLSTELAAIDRQYPDWHAFCTGTVCWASCSHTPWHGGGVTVDAPNPQMLIGEIARELQRWKRETGWAA